MNPIYLRLDRRGKRSEYTVTATISVTLTDENDPPALNNQTMSVNENSPNNTEIGSALAGTDPDEDALTYSIIGGTGASALKISTDGQISVNNVSLLDYENIATSYTVIAQVADPDGLTDTATITVNINNVNESPVMTSGQGATIAENLANGSLVYTVTSCCILIYCII
jgi:Cadherin domain.